MAYLNLSKPKDMEYRIEMSSQAPIGLTIMEKLIGLLLIAVGALWFYVSYINMPSVPVVFLALAAVIIGIGVLLVIAKFE
jgi:membrane protein YdbS with pleckstrin-like domain